jgi:hypothetical protein
MYEVLRKQIYLHRNRPSANVIFSPEKLFRLMKPPKAIIFVPINYQNFLN